MNTQQELMAKITAVWKALPLSLRADTLPLSLREEALFLFLKEEALPLPLI